MEKGIKYIVIPPKRKLTKNLCAINYLSKCGDNYFAIATFLNQRGLEPLVYDSKLNDYKNHSIYFSAYSDKEDRNLLDSGRAPKSTIYAYNIDTEKIENVYSTDLYIIGMAVSNNLLYLTVAKNGVADKEYNKTMSLDIKTKQEELFEYNGIITGNMENIDKKCIF